MKNDNHRWTIRHVGDGSRFDAAAGNREEQP